MASRDRSPADILELWVLWGVWNVVGASGAQTSRMTEHPVHAYAGNSEWERIRMGDTLTRCAMSGKRVRQNLWSQGCGDAERQMFLGSGFGICERFLSHAQASVAG